MPLPAPASQKTSRSRASIAAACSGVGEVSERSLAAPLVSSSSPSARSSRQIGWNVQYSEHLPPSGSRLMSPAAHPPAVSIARRARSLERLLELLVVDGVALDRRVSRPPTAAPSSPHSLLAGRSRAAGGRRTRRAAGRGPPIGSSAEAFAGDEHVELELELALVGDLRHARDRLRGLVVAQRPPAFPPGSTSIRSIRPRRANSPRSSAPGSSVLLAEAEAALEQVGARAQHCRAAPPRSSRNPRPGSAAARAPSRRSGVAADSLSATTASRSSLKRAFQRADVAGPRDRVLARRLRRRAGRAPRGRCRRARAGRPPARVAAASARGRRTTGTSTGSSPRASSRSAGRALRDGLEHARVLRAAPACAPGSGIPAVSASTSPVTARSTPSARRGAPAGARRRGPRRCGHRARQRARSGAPPGRPGPPERASACA